MSRGKLVAIICLAVAAMSLALANLARKQQELVGEAEAGAARVRELRKAAETDVAYATKQIKKAEEIIAKPLPEVVIPKQRILKFPPGSDIESMLFAILEAPNGDYWVCWMNEESTQSNLADLKEGAACTIMPGRRNGRDYKIVITWEAAEETKGK